MPKGPVPRLLIALALLVVAVLVVRWFGSGLMHWFMAMHGRH